MGLKEQTKGGGGEQAGTEPDMVRILSHEARSACGFCAGHSCSAVMVEAADLVSLGTLGGRVVLGSAKWLCRAAMVRWAKQWGGSLAGWVWS